MKTRTLIVGLCLVLTSVLADELSWSDLVRQPEFWPAECSINRSIKFQGGGSVQAGQKLDVVELRAAQVAVGTKDGRMTFAVKPEDTDALAEARAAWAKLSPAQRGLTYATLLHRQDLWPYRVELMLPMELSGNRKVSRGEQLVLIGVEGSQLLVLSEKVNTSFNVEPQQTDLIEYARKYVGDKAGAPSRIAEELRGKLLDPATGSPAALELKAHPRYFVFYRGAGWCGPCRQFSPSLVKTYNQLRQKHSDFELIFLSEDHSLSDLQKYVKEENFPWLAVRSDRLKDLRLVTPYLGQTIPQLIILDSGGKLLVDSDRADRAAALERLTAMLEQPAK